MKLIDADAIHIYINRLSGCGLGKKKALEYLRKYVEEQPEAVVRCKDCKHADHRRDVYGEFLVCEHDYYEIPLIRNADSYCSEGERRPDETS